MVIFSRMPGARQGQGVIAVAVIGVRCSRGCLPAGGGVLTWSRRRAGVQLTQHGEAPTVEVAGMYWASNGTGRCATLPGNSSSRGYVLGHGSRLPAASGRSRFGYRSKGWELSIQPDTPATRDGRGRVAIGRSNEDLARLPWVPATARWRRSGVGYLADRLRGHGHQVTVYAQRPHGSSFPASHEYPVRRFADWVARGSFRSRRARPRIVARQRAV